VILIYGFFAFILNFKINQNRKTAYSELLMVNEQVRVYRKHMDF